MPAMDYFPAGSDRPNVRVPKLAVRNRSDNSIPLSEEASPATSTISVISQSSALQDRRDSEQSVETTRPLPATRKLEKPAKKSGGVFGFLSLKEPSTSAWEDYAKQQKLQVATAKFGASKQKLPDHVPKVNSKWDGLPDSVKRNGPRMSESSSQPRQSGQTRRSVNGGRSMDSSGSSQTRRAVKVNTPRSKPGSVNLPSIVIPDGIEVLPTTQSEQASVTRPSASSSPETAPATTQPAPPLEHVATSPTVQDQFQSPSSINSPDFAIELDSTELHQLAADDHNTASEASPQTLSIDRHTQEDEVGDSNQPDVVWPIDTNAAAQTLPSTPEKGPVSPHTPVSSPSRSVVMNFSRPSRPVIETTRPVLSSPTTRAMNLSPTLQGPSLATQPFNEPIELPCPSTCPPSPTPRPPKAKTTSRSAHDETKRGRLSVMLGFR